MSTQPKDNKKTAIILAAGLGTRLKDLTIDTPKPLMIINGKPILHYAVKFLQAAGVEKIIVVGGFQIEKVREALKGLDGDIELKENKNFKMGNLYSLECGLENVEGSFLVFHADHIYRKEIAEKVKKQFAEKIIIFTDNDRQLTDDDMKVKTDETGKYLKNVSKKLTDFSLGYVGITFCHAKYLELYKDTIEKVKAIYGENAVTENVMQFIVDNRLANIDIGDISGYKWLEVDFPDELEKARAEIEKNKDLYF